MIRRILDLSTSHITAETAGSLWKCIAPSTIAVEARGSDDVAFVLLHVPDDIADRRDEWPADLWRVAICASSLKCDFIKFDRDAEEIDGLPTYEW